MLRNIIKLLNNYECHGIVTRPLLFRSFAVNASQSSANAGTEGLEEQQIAEAIRVEPALSSVSPQMWQKCHETFINHGLDTHSFFRIAIGNPNVLKRSPQRIIETLEYWRSCQFGEYFLFQLLTKYPGLLDVQNRLQLAKKIAFLQSYVGSAKNVWKLLMNCPDLVQQPEENIEKKILYMKETMRIEIPEIVKSEALSKTLFDIQCRHKLLERLGMFKPRPLKADPNDPTTNPRLYKITDSSEKSFATKVCHITLAEYEAFKELYAKELEEQRREEEDEDLEDDDDEEEEEVYTEMEVKHAAPKARK